MEFMRIVNPTWPESPPGRLTSSFAWQLGVLQLLDLWITHFAIVTRLATEGNHIAAAGMSVGFWVAVVAKVAATLLAIHAVAFMARRHQWATAVGFLGFWWAAMLAVVTWNSAVVLKWA